MSTAYYKSHPATQAMRYRIVSRADLPARMLGLFSFREAYALCCDWNAWHCVREMALPECVEDIE